MEYIRDKKIYNIECLTYKKTHNKLFNVPCSMLRGGGGFTLIEVIIAVAVFVLIFTVILNVFNYSSRTREKISSSQNVRNHLQYAVELMSREIRTMKDIEEDQTNSQRTKLECLSFENYNCDNIEYCLTDENGNYDANGEYITRNGEVFTSSDVEIEELNFYVNEFKICVAPTAPNTEIQPSITIFIKGKGKNNEIPQSSLLVQTTISPRFYPYKTDYCAGVKPCP